MRPSLEFSKNLFSGKKVIGVEVGVDIGENANDILSNFPNIEKLYLVDVVDNIHDRFKNEVISIFFIHRPSVEAAKEFQDEYFDFVYIDANHSYQAVKDDLNAWCPKLKVGGVICGHDFSAEDIPLGLCVGAAATDFFALHGLELFTAGPDFWGIKNAK